MFLEDFSKPSQMTDRVGGLLLEAGFNELGSFLILRWWEILQPRQSKSVPGYARRALLLPKRKRDDSSWWG